MSKNSENTQKVSKKLSKNSKNCWQCSKRVKEFKELLAILRKCQRIQRNGQRIQRTAGSVQKESKNSKNCLQNSERVSMTCFFGHQPLGAAADLLRGMLFAHRASASLEACCSGRDDSAGCEPKCAHHRAGWPGCFLRSIRSNANASPNSES